jgi:HD-GYP domain-containing protein (c-di-GMP phosphodiesterase class II)
MAAAARLSEVVAILARATDLAWGQPREYAWDCCRLALRLAEAAGADRETRRQIYYHALLRYLGCNAETSLLAAVAGDDILFRKDYARIDGSDLTAVLRVMWRSVRESRPEARGWDLVRSGARSLLAMPRLRDSLEAHCEVAQRLGARLGLAPSLLEALGQLYERWDGSGFPRKLRGEALAFSTRAVALSHDAVVFHHLGGPAAARSVIRKRRGKAYDPALADRFLRDADGLLAGLDGAGGWEGIIACEPLPGPPLSEAALDGALAAMADFCEVKSLHFLGHSPAVADLAEAAGRAAGLAPEVTLMLRRAGWAHNLGRVAVSAGIWDKPGPLSREEGERMRLYPYHTERLLSVCPALAGIAALAGRHAERLDASGYHRGLPAGMLAFPDRILAAATAYRAMRESRPWREAHASAAAADLLAREAKAGRLDRDAVGAVLAADGQAAQGRRTRSVAGLTGREIEVLGLLACGHTIKAMAERLYLSPKTVDRHIQNIYGKIGVSTRAAAALFASENRLL